jgi:hypothetical protein
MSSSLKKHSMINTEEVFMDKTKTIVLICLALLTLVSLLPGCNNGSDNPSPIPPGAYSTTPVVNDILATSNTADGHVHTITLLSKDLATPPAAGVTYTSSITSNHTHTVTLTTQQLNEIQNGGSVSVTSSSTVNPADGVNHSHVWLLTRSLIITSSVNDGHTHDITIPPQDLLNPPAGGIVYYTTTNQDHAHTVPITQGQLTDIYNRMQVTVTSLQVVNPTTGNRHAHDWIIIKP